MREFERGVKGQRDLWVGGMLDEGLGGHGLATVEDGGWGAEAEADAGVEVGYLGVVGGAGVDRVGGLELEEDGVFIAKVVFC